MLLQPHEGPSETEIQDLIDNPDAGFNPTRVRLKPDVF